MKGIGNRWSGPIRTLMRQNVASCLMLNGFMSKEMLGERPTYIGTGANSLVFEQLLAEGKLGPKFSLVKSVEKDKKTYKEALQVKPAGVVVEKANLTSQVGPNRPWDFIWWDGMGTIQEKSINLLQNCVQSVCTAGGGIVGITYQARRENIKGINDRIRKKIIQTATKQEAGQRGMISTPIITIRYGEIPGYHQTTKKIETKHCASTPMIVQFFSITKTDPHICPIEITMNREGAERSRQRRQQYKNRIMKAKKAKKHKQLELVLERI